eukprot:TRINITY_DN18253_c0_g1_i1.p2 TRINITY_DN18253_c0_g1~~TRINITY_DN18253_c0_g1_i1.p2  ORF type:complete len:195 (+),score=24.58 TRINITY_DN18253_c0_g1_i1:42-626(+)
MEMMACSAGGPGGPGGPGAVAAFVDEPPPRLCAGGTGEGRELRKDCPCCLAPVLACFKFFTHCECVPIRGRSMLPTIRGGPEMFGSDCIVSVRPSHCVPIWPEPGEVIVLVDKTGRMVKRVRYVAVEEGCERRAWCWVEGDNLSRSEDSRFFGWYPSHRIQAVAVGICCPPWRARRLVPRGRLWQALTHTETWS